MTASDAIDAAVEAGLFGFRSKRAEQHGIADPNDLILADDLTAAVTAAVEAAAPALLAAERERIARDIEVAHGLRCPECYGKPASIRGFKHQCGGGHKWEQPLGSWYVSGAIAIARGSVAGKPAGGSS